MFAPGYEKGLAPKLWVNGTKVNEPLPVYFGVDILSFDQINTIDMMIGYLCLPTIPFASLFVFKADFADQHHLERQSAPIPKSEGKCLPESGFGT